MSIISSQLVLTDWLAKGEDGMSLGHSIIIHQPRSSTWKEYSISNLRCELYRYRELYMPALGKGLYWTTWCILFTCSLTIRTVTVSLTVPVWRCERIRGCAVDVVLPPDCGMWIVEHFYKGMFCAQSAWSSPAYNLHACYNRIETFLPVGGWILEELLTFGDVVYIDGVSVSYFQWRKNHIFIWQN